MKRFKKDLMKYRKYMVYSAKAELKAEVANSHLGWLWWILDPLLFMLVYAFVSSIVFKAKEDYFMAFIFVGVTTWEFFNKTLKQSVKLVTSNSQIVTKVYIPKFVFVISKMGTNAIKMGISFALVIGMMTLYRVPLSAKMFCFFPIMIVLFVVTFGMSMILMHLGVFVEDLANVVNVGLRLVFYLSGVFYSISNRIPEPYQSILLKVNPVALIMEDLRRSVLYGKLPHYFSLGLWFILGIALSVIGIKTVYKYENSYVKYCLPVRCQLCTVLFFKGCGAIFLVFL